ncbi:triphosphate tunnel metalloenzyme 3 [Daucus carota subsp. sativus]|nr:PREDICTED: triphosphate tunel metalloenzyme 3-like [Daucus carota subsp. sativus]
MMKACPKHSILTHQALMPSLSFSPSRLIQFHSKPLNCRTLNSSSLDNPSNPTEVEVKLRLPNSHSHQTLTTLLSQFHTQTHLQENIFFDGLNSELTSSLSVLRLRFYNQDSKCVISLKSKPRISSGISRVFEDEEPIDSSIGRSCVAEPGRLLLIDELRIVKRVREEFGVEGLVCLGGFKNVRRVYDWNGLKLEVDETMYDFGTCYEVECESVEPEKAKKLMEELLRRNGIEYCYSQVSKFATFVSRKLPK